MRTSGAAPADVAAVGVAGMLPAVVLLDPAGRLLRPSIQQSDARCGAEVDELRAEIDEKAFLAKAGNGVNQQLVAGKLRWIERHEPEVFSRIGTVFGSYDYINWRLTGERAIEQNWALAVLNVVYDRLKREYDEAGNGEHPAQDGLCLLSRQLLDTPFGLLHAGLGCLKLIGEDEQ